MDLFLPFWLEHLIPYLQKIGAIYAAWKILLEGFHYFTSRTPVLNLTEPYDIPYEYYETGRIDYGSKIRVEGWLSPHTFIHLPKAYSPYIQVVERLPSGGIKVGGGSSFLPNGRVSLANINDRVIRFLYPLDFQGFNAKINKQGLPPDTLSVLSEPRYLEVATFPESACPIPVLLPNRFSNLAGYVDLQATLSSLPEQHINSLLKLNGSVAEKVYAFFAKDEGRPPYWLVCDHESGDYISLSADQELRQTEKIGTLLVEIHIEGVHESKDISRLVKDATHILPGPEGMSIRTYGFYSMVYHWARSVFNIVYAPPNMIGFYRPVVLDVKILVQDFIDAYQLFIKAFQEQYFRAFGRYPLISVDYIWDFTLNRHFGNVLNSEAARIVSSDRLMSDVFAALRNANM